MKETLLFSVLLLNLFLTGCATSVIRVGNDVVLNGAGVFGINAERDFFADITLPDSLTRRWEGETNGNLGFNSVVTTGQLVFLSDLSGRIYCFNKITGKRVGYLRYKGSIECAPVIKKNLLIFPLVKLNNGETNLIIYDFAKGSELYKIDVRGKVISYPLIDEQYIYLLTTVGSVVKISLNGEVEWRRDLKFRNTSNLFRLKNSIYFGDDTGKIIRLNYATGELINEIKISDSPVGNLSIKENIIYTSDDAGICYAIKDDEVLWKYNSGSRIAMYPASDNSNIYFGTLSGDIFALQKGNGTLLWKANHGGVISAAPLVLNSQLIVPNLDRKVLFLEKQSGRLIKQMNFEGRVRHTPAVDSINIYFGYDNYLLGAYAIR